MYKLSEAKMKWRKGEKTRPKKRKRKKSEHIQAKLFETRSEIFKEKFLRK